MPEKNPTPIIETPTGPLKVVRQQAERMLTEGIISGELDGRLHAADAAIVKASLMASAVCDLCSAPGATHHYDIPDYGVTTPRPGNYGAAAVQYGGGWVICDGCKALVEANKRQALIERALTTMAFPKFTRSMVAGFVDKFWKGMDDKAAAIKVGAILTDYVEERIPAHEDPTPQTPRDTRIRAVADATGLSRDDVTRLLNGSLDRALITKLAVAARAGTFKRPSEARAVIDKFVNGPRKPLESVVPHWQQALDARFAALKFVTLELQHPSASYYTPESVDLKDRTAVINLAKQAEESQKHVVQTMTVEAHILRHAETYSFNADTIAAIREASTSIPTETPLSAVEIPTGAGWFWFSEPLVFGPTSPISALAYGWKDQNGVGILWLSAYYVNDQGIPVPIFGWTWPAHKSIATIDSEAQFRPDMSRRDVTPVEAAEYNATISQLSRFFVMACLWFKQTVPILTKEPGHVERHARKRYQREHKLDAPPTVQVIALRKSQRTAAADAPSERQPGAREYHCRWIVRGHARLQACGPGRKDRKLIWVESHLAGPDGAPLRVKERVYAVIR